MDVLTSWSDEEPCLLSCDDIHSVDEKDRKIGGVIDLPKYR
jgi:hypothetical protein